MRELQLPDGRIVEIPDDITPEQKAMLQDKVRSMVDTNQPQADQRGFIQKATDVGKEGIRVADYAIRSGLFGLPKAALDVGDVAYKAAKKSPLVPKTLTEPIPGLGDVLNVFNKVMTPMKPQTPEGKVIGDIGASTVGAMAGPGSMARNAKIGLGSGIGSELLVNTFGDNAMTRILGSMLGGGATSAALMERNNRNALAREVLKNVEPEDLEKARLAQIQSEQLEIPVNLSQAMSKPSNIDTYVNTIVNTDQGNRLAKQLRDQPAKIADKMEDVLAELPGNHLSPHGVANETQDAATDYFKGLRGEASDTFTSTLVSSRDKLANKLVKDSQKASTIYNNIQPISPAEASRLSTQVDEKSVNIMIDRLTGIMEGLGKHNSKRALVKNLRDRLLDKDKLPVTDAARIHDDMKDFMKSLKSENLNNKSFNTDAAKYAKSLAMDVIDGLGGGMAPYKEARTAYKEFVDAVINPAKKSEIGRLAGRLGAMPDKEAASGVIQGIFNRGTTPGAPSEILNVERAFRKVNHQEAFLNAGKTWLAEGISEAKKSKTHRLTDNIAENLTAMFGAPQIYDRKSKGTYEVLVGMARSMGIKDDTAFAKGFSRLMSTVAMAARRPGSVTGTSAMDIEETARKGLTRTLGQVSIITPIRQPALKWASYLRDDALGTMDRLLSSSDGVAQLILLGKEHRMSPVANNIIATLLATNVNARAAEDENQTNIVE